MPDSILDDIKAVLGIQADDQSFDLDITMFLNSAFGTLYQLDAGPVDGFSISDNTAVWSDYTTNVDMLGLVKSYLTMYVRLTFDPPANSFALAAIKGQLSDLESQINILAEELRPPSDPFAA
jgi:hypothetical protein